MGKEKNQRRSWSRLNEESFVKIQTLEAVVAGNTDTIKALDESIAVHGKGAILLGDNEDTKPMAEQFVHIIGSHTKSSDNLKKFNVDATIFLALLKQEKDPAALKLVEAMLKIVSFK